MNGAFKLLTLCARIVQGGTVDFESWIHLFQWLLLLLVFPCCPLAPRLSTSITRLVLRTLDAWSRLGEREAHATDMPWGRSLLCSLLGMTIMQAWFYYGHFPKDPLWMKLVVSAPTELTPRIPSDIRDAGYGNSVSIISLLYITPPTEANFPALSSSYDRHSQLTPSGFILYKTGETHSRYPQWSGKLF